MKLIKLELRIQTDDGPYEAVIDFSDGLTLVWADNSQGKSTCTKAIIVALGLEAMITTHKKSLPLTPAISEQIEDNEGNIHKVIESDVFLEFQNSRGQTVTLQRTVKGTRDMNMITVFNGPLLSRGEHSEARDYYVNHPGAAKNESGFHSFLAKFLGWNLPRVPTFDDIDRPLYLQCIFPFFIVEQSKGWHSIQPTLPTHFGIKEVANRVVEFILKLDAHKIALLRQSLNSEKDKLKAEWTRLYDELSSLAGRFNGRLSGLPVTPTSQWPPKEGCDILFPEENSWVGVKEKLATINQEIDNLSFHEIPRVAETIKDTDEELQKRQDELRKRESILSQLLDQLEIEKRLHQSTDNRIRTIKEDITRNNDIKKLLNMGAENLECIGTKQCPTCHRPIQDSLIQNTTEHPIMTLDENIEFLREQQQTFSSMLAQVKRNIEFKENRIKAHQVVISEIRSRIRFLRETLIQDGRQPSIAAIQKRILLDGLVVEFKELLDRFSNLMEIFSNLSAKWRENAIAIENLPKTNFSKKDSEKLSSWLSDFREKLTSFGFRSLKTEKMTISPVTFRPEYDEFELGFDVSTASSASDLIRVIWAYLTSLLSVARIYDTNHIGLVLFDEPKQQSANRVSFTELIREACSTKSFGQQFIIFSSEDQDSLKKSLSGISRDLYTVVKFPDKVITKKV